MIARLKIITVIVMWTIFAAPLMDANAQDPRGQCDPDSSIGHSARVVSMSGDVSLYDYKGAAIRIAAEGVIPEGAIIETGADGTVVLALEDGTTDRMSRLNVDPKTRVSLTGGLFCSDLRPKRDEGRWSAREINLELIDGSVLIDIAENVSHSFNLAVNMPNAAARMMRSSQQPMNAAFRVSGFQDRKQVPLMEHPEIRRHSMAFMMGRDIDELAERERQGILGHAAMAALGMGLIDLEEAGVLENPQIKGMMGMMTQGRDLSALSDDERKVVLATIGGLAVQEGLINPEEIMVYNHPDEMAYIAVNAGKMRVHNKHRGYRRDETVAVEAGFFSNVKGYDIPDGPAKLE